MRRLGTLCSQSYMCSKYVNVTPISSFVRHRTVHKVASPLAFVFDIDGVLIRGDNPLPAAKHALSILDGNNRFGIKIPYLLLTNGGGVSESARCHKLSQQLGMKIDPERFIQAHTVLKSVVHKYADLPVLVLGGKGNTLRKVAEGYGFKHVYTTLDILAWNRSVCPLHDHTVEEREPVKTVDFSKTCFAAIIVFHDPPNWFLDIQVMCDLIQSGGILDGPYQPKHMRKPVDLVFCNPDLVWKSDFDRPRLGQGAFKEAFQGVFKSLTGAPYPYTQFGKPTEATYKFAEQMLRGQLVENSSLDSVLVHGWRQSRIRYCRGECRTLEVYTSQDRCLRPSSGTAKPPSNTRGRGRGASCAVGTRAGVSAVSMRRQGRRKTLPRFEGLGIMDLDVAHRLYLVNLDVTVAMAASMPMINMVDFILRSRRTAI